MRRIMLAALTVMLVGAAATPAAATPVGRTVYVTHGNSNTISIFTVTATGDLSPVGDPVPTLPRPRGIVFSPDGEFAYVVNSGADRVSTFRVGGGGELTLVGTPVATGDEPFGVAMSPDGHTVYVTNLFDLTVSAFAVQSDGTLASAGAPVPVSDEGSPRGVAVSPDGRRVFVSVGDPGTATPGHLVVLDRALNVVRDIEICPGPFGIGITPDSRFLYVACSFTDEIRPFEVDTLTALTPAPAPDFPDAAVVSGDGRFVFVTNPSPDGSARGVRVFSVDTDGTLSQAAGLDRAGGFPAWVTPTPDGRNLYVSNEDLSGELFGFTVADTGALAALTGSPFDTRGEFSMFQAVNVRPNQGPAAAFTTRPAPAGQPTRFDASASTDPDGRVARYDWDFGDGTVARDAGPTPRHTYTVPGRYRVTLTVTDNEGCSTRLVFTGQSALCDGSPAAKADKDVAVPS